MDKKHEMPEASQWDVRMKDTLNYFRTALPVAAAMVLFLLSAGFIAYKLIIAYRYNERWKDYDECGV